MPYVRCDNFYCRIEFYKQQAHLHKKNYCSNACKREGAKVYSGGYITVEREGEQLLRHRFRNRIKLKEFLTLYTEEYPLATAIITFDATDIQ